MAGKIKLNEMHEKWKALDPDGQPIADVDSGKEAKQPGKAGDSEQPKEATKKLEEYNGFRVHVHTDVREFTYEEKEVIQKAIVAAAKNRDNGVNKIQDIEFYKGPDGTTGIAIYGGPTDIHYLDVIKAALEVYKTSGKDKPAPKAVKYQEDPIKVDQALQPEVDEIMEAVKNLLLR
jgi:hypothetical protein